MKRDPLELKASDVRIGMEVRYDGKVWGVWSQAPETGTFWLTRWFEKAGERVNETVKAHVNDMSRNRSVAPAPAGRR